MHSLAAYASDDDDDDHDDMSESDDLNVTTQLFSNLPSQSIGSASTRSNNKDDILDEIVQKHDWELIEAPRPPSKPQRKTIGGPIRIAAFGSLTNTDGGGESSSEDDGDEFEVKTTTKNSKAPLALLSMLPKPKSTTTSTTKMKSATLLLPDSIRIKNKKQKMVEEERIRNSTSTVSTTNMGIDRVEKDDEDDDEEDNMDYFGLTGVADEPTTAADGFRLSTVNYGPVRPTIEQQMAAASSQSLQHPSQLDNLANVDDDNNDDKPSKGQISDEQAARMIYKHELAPWGFSGAAASAAVGEMIDVSVDASLGPDVRANLLKNLSGKSLPIAPKSVGKKTKEARDVTAKRKHQITYLAQVAVDREDQLKEQWSQNKHTKRMAAQKYGF